MMMKRSIPISIKLLLAACSLVLVACGGGGSSDATGGDTVGNEQPAETAVMYGSFSDLPVSGLFYETETQSGLTDAQGRFRFMQGENINFRLGKTQLGGTVASVEISPLELLGLDPVTDEAELLQLLKSPMINSLDLVLNINTLLISLDSDGLPENGIQLGDAHTHLESLDKELDIAIKATDFSSNPEISQLVQDLVSRPPQSLTFVATRLYERLNLEVKVKRISASKAQTNGQSRFSQAAEYNEQGLLAAESFRLSDDQELFDLDYVYDAKQRLQTVSNSYTGDTKSLKYEQDRLTEVMVINDHTDTRYKEQMLYDAAGNLLQLSVDQNGDGEIDMLTRYEQQAGVERVSTTKIENGTAIESVRLLQLQDQLIERLQEDYDNDGQIDLEMHYSYDEFSRMSSRKIVSHDPAIDSATSFFEYDERDQLIRYSVDTDENGEIDYIEVYDYDHQGNRILFKRDLDADGVWNYSAFYRYDAQGNQIELNEDTDGNGILDMQWKAELEQVSIASSWHHVLSEL
jgi:hypothetical protein